MTDGHTMALAGASVLVVGGAGFVGSNFVLMLLRSGVASVDVVDNLMSAELNNVPDDQRVRFIEGSIADDRVLSDLGDRFDLVFHLATYHGNQSSIHDPIADHANNTITTLKLMHHMAGFKRLRCLVYSGAGCSAAEKTFGAPVATAEDAPLSLVQDSPYSISKIVGEFYSVYFHRQHDLPVVRVRFQNVYGPGEKLGAGRWRGTPATVWRNVIPTFVYRALKNQALPIQNGGIATRDFVFVDDICRGLIAAALAGKPGDVYNLASGCETSVLDLGNMVNRLAGNGSGIQMEPARNWDHSGRRYGSTQKASDELGFSTKIDIEEGLMRTITWTRGNMAEIERCISRHADMMANFGTGRSAAT